MPPKKSKFKILSEKDKEDPTNTTEIEEIITTDKTEKDNTDLDLPEDKDNNKEIEDIMETDKTTDLTEEELKDKTKTNNKEDKEEDITINPEITITEDITTIIITTTTTNNNKTTKTERI